jgi:hypothetical protein
MEISPKALRLALLRLYQEAGLAADQPLSAGGLGVAWKQTGLRSADLEQAIQALLARGELRGNSHEGYAITSAGQASFAGLETDLEQGSLKDEAALIEARFRKAEHNPTPGKRLEDRKLH